MYDNNTMKTVTENHHKLEELPKWMTAASTQHVMDALSWPTLNPRFVGGCVRDILMDRPVNDIDIATPLEPKHVVNCLEASRIRWIDTGLKHGTLTAVVDGDTFEITTLRRDVECDGRHAKVEFTDDWAVDAARRDFTMNALSLDMDGVVYDYVNGLKDLDDGVVCFVGNPYDRLEEDVLRLLRFFRFHAFFGRELINVDSVLACLEYASNLANLPAERIWKELRKLLSADDPTEAVYLMKMCEVWDIILPQVATFDSFNALIKYENIAKEPPDPIRRLASLLMNRTIDGLELIPEKLKMSKTDRVHLLDMVQMPDIHTYPTYFEARTLLYELGPVLFRNKVLLSYNHMYSTAGRNTLNDLLALPTLAPIPDFPLTGKDVLFIGVERGERVGELLSSVRNWWARHDFVASHYTCMKHLLEIVHPYTEKDITK